VTRQPNHIFREADINKDGRLDRRELHQLLDREMGMAADDVDLLIAEYDGKGDESLNEREFEKAYHALLPSEFAEDADD